jgi:hypothetical protein
VKRLAIPVLLCATGLAITAPAERTSAQPLGPHCRLDLPSKRPLHARVALADGAAIATIEAVGLGRIRVRDAIPVLGDVTPAFELKRAPWHPPALEPGDRALLLRGARSPYVLVDDGEETRVLADAESEALRRQAVRDIHRSLGSGLLDPYRTRLDGAAASEEFEQLAREDPDPRVRAAALRALGRPATSD